MSRLSVKHIKHTAKGAGVVLFFVCIMVTAFAYADQALPAASQLNTNQKIDNSHINSNLSDEKRHSQVNWMGPWLHEDLCER